MNSALFLTLLLVPSLLCAEENLDPRQFEPWIGRPAKGVIEVVRSIGTDNDQFPRTNGPRNVYPPLEIRLFNAQGYSEIVVSDTYSFEKGCNTYPKFKFKQNSTNTDWVVALPEAAVPWTFKPAPLKEVSSTRVPDSYWDSLMPLTSPDKVTRQLFQVKGIDSVLFASINAQRHALPGTRSAEESPTNLRTASAYELFSIDEGVLYPLSAPRTEAETWPQHVGYLPLIGEFSNRYNRLLIGAAPQDTHKMYYVRLHVDKGHYIDSRASIPDACEQRYASAR